MKIRRAGTPDAAAIAAIILLTTREAATYALDTKMSEANALARRHVRNCDYMTSAKATGRGIARRVCEHSIDHVRSKGYRAMQFNLVVSTNERAVRLWESLGFEAVGRLPLAFRYPRFVGVLSGPQSGRVLGPSCSSSSRLVT